MMITGSTFDFRGDNPDHMMIGVTTRDVIHIRAALVLMALHMDVAESDPQVAGEVKTLLQGFAALDKVANMSPTEREKLTSRG